jgi:hypothetical protein
LFISGIDLGCSVNPRNATVSVIFAEAGLTAFMRGILHLTSWNFGCYAYRQELLVRQAMNAFVSNGVSELLRLSVIQGKGDRTVAVKQPRLLQIALLGMGQVLSWNGTVPF